MIIELKRSYFPEGTNGKLECEGRRLCYTIELPWKQNAKGVSCIPEGKYLLKKRYSAKYKHHLLVEGVPQRSLILLHPANYAMQELQGCIAPVSKISGSGVGLQSRKACQKLFALVFTTLAKGEEVVLIVSS